MLVNTSRGALVDVEAVVEGLKTGQIGYLAIDVYEQEADLFFQDLSNEIIQDDAFQRLLTFPNVLVTGHQAFFTAEALTAIADTTLANITAFERGEPLANAVGAELVKGALSVRGRCCGRGRRARSRSSSALLAKLAWPRSGSVTIQASSARCHTCTQRSRLSISQISRTDGSSM